MSDPRGGHTVGAGRPWSRLGDVDLHLFNEGRHSHCHERLGAHPARHEGRDGTYFAVWAPNASAVAVIGDFDDWQGTDHPLAARGTSGIWEGFVPGVGTGARYKFRIRSRIGGYVVDKADPYARSTELPPATASVVWASTYRWGDEDWMAQRGARIALDAPISILELHLGSWRRRDGGWLGYREIAAPLVEHIRASGFTHVELLPVMEHPFYGSWGYQVTGYFAPTARYGSPDDLKFLIDALHRAGIGVLLDWVPSHFPADEHGLAFFDGTHLYEHADPRRGFHPDWASMIFNYGRSEVMSFLLSNARYWLDEFHADGLRVDAVASMLYLDYSRREGEWLANRHGGRENLEAVDFLRTMNAVVYADFPDVQTIAEESTAWPLVSRPVSMGGLGFGLKWDMGWMHDSLRYLRVDPVHRRWHHRDLTFRSLYAWNENFVLSLSHDEVVHGKGSLIEKMPGDDWQRFANLRLLYAMMYATPGKKLLFMGSEFATWREWNHEAELDWSLLDHERHRGVLRLVHDLNRILRDYRALHELDCEPTGFEWIEVDNSEESVLVTLRRGRDRRELVVIAMNFTPVPRAGHRVGVPEAGTWREILNSDAEIYGGSGQGNFGSTATDPRPCGWHPYSLNLTLPPLAAVFLAFTPS